MNTDKIIKKYIPLTMKEVHEFEKEYIPKFDVKYTHSNSPTLIHPDASLRELANNTYDNLDANYSMWIKNIQLYETDNVELDLKLIPYIMSITVDNMHEDGVPLKFSFKQKHFVIAIDHKSNSKKCKAFYEKFYHLTYGYNYPDFKSSDYNMPEAIEEDVSRAYAFDNAIRFGNDKTIQLAITNRKLFNELVDEANEELTEKRTSEFFDKEQDKFDIKMKIKLGDRYNNRNNEYK